MSHLVQLSNILSFKTFCLNLHVVIVALYTKVLHSVVEYIVLEHIARLLARQWGDKIDVNKSIGTNTGMGNSTLAPMPLNQTPL